MRIWSSIHFFTANIDAAIDYCALDIRDKKDEDMMIQTYFDRYFDLRIIDLDTIPLHDNDRFFAELFAKKYPVRTPSWVIRNDFEKEGLHLNLYGDIVKTPKGISVFSSRYFGGNKIESLMSNIICDMSREMQCPVLSYTFMESPDEIFCKIYVSSGREYGVVHCSTSPTKNVERNLDLLYRVFPVLKHKNLNANISPFDFSQRLCASLDIIEARSQYEQQIAEKTIYVKTYKLYDIYEDREAGPLL